VKEWHELRRGPMQRLRSASTRPPGPESATERASLTERIDYLAMVVTMLPDRPLTTMQRDLIRTIARELLRRANE
jgi:hypothetical protein